MTVNIRKNDLKQKFILKINMVYLFVIFFDHLLLAGQVDFIQPSWNLICEILFYGYSIAAMFSIFYISDHKVLKKFVAIVYFVYIASIIVNILYLPLLIIFTMIIFLKRPESRKLILYITGLLLFILLYNLLSVSFFGNVIIKTKSDYIYSSDRKYLMVVKDTNAENSLNYGIISLYKIEFYVFKKYKEEVFKGTLPSLDKITWVDGRRIKVNEQIIVVD